MQNPSKDHNTKKMYSTTYQRKKFRKPNVSSLKPKDSVIGVSPVTGIDESEKRGEAQTQSFESPSHSVPQSSPQKETRENPPHSVPQSPPLKETRSFENLPNSVPQSPRKKETRENPPHSVPQSPPLKETRDLPNSTKCHLAKTYQRKKLGKPNFSSLKLNDSIIRVSPALEVDESEKRGEAQTQSSENHPHTVPQSLPQEETRENPPHSVPQSPPLEETRDLPNLTKCHASKTYQRKKFGKPNISSLKPNDSTIGVSPALEVDESEKRGEAQTQSLENPPHSVTQSPPQKKTRDLPNLTECHSCGFKVDVCSGKNGLRILNSEWRIVLLCKKCFSSVKSSKICSYCFSGTTTESFNCNKCRHSVHRSCFFNYKSVAPWSYSCLGSDFSVCVDCWIPKSMELSRRRLRIRKIKMVEKTGRVVLEKGGSRVLGGENLVRSIEDVANDANRVAEKKGEAAARTRDAAMKKAVVARKAVKLANNAMSLVANREEEGSLKLPPKLDPVNVIGGSELMFDLHPHLNSSIKNSKSCCFLNTSYLSCSVDILCKTSNSRNASGCDDKDKVFNEDKLYEDSNKSLCKPSVSIGSLDADSSAGLNRPCMGRSDLKTSPKDGECTAEFDILEIGKELLKEGEGCCSDQLINLNGEDGGLELDRKQANSVLHGVERLSERPDRYFLLKYSRRKCLKPNL